MEHAEPLDIKQLTKSAVAQYPALPIEPLQIYLDSILEWNERAGLISPHDPLATLSRLVAQSARLWEMVGEVHAPVRRVVDVGTGAGFPGMIWKLLDPEIEIVLIDRRVRKATFLQRTLAVLGLEGADVFEGEAEDAARLSGLAGSCDAAAAVAVGAPMITAPIVTPFLRSGGVFATVLPAGDPPPARVGQMVLAVSEEDPRGTRCIFRLVEADGTPPE